MSSFDEHNSELVALADEAISLGEQDQASMLEALVGMFGPAPEDIGEAEVAEVLVLQIEKRARAIDDGAISLPDIGSVVRVRGDRSVGGNGAGELHGVGSLRRGPIG